MVEGVLERNHLHHSSAAGLTLAQSGAECSRVGGLRTQTWSSARTLGNSPLWCSIPSAMTWTTLPFLGESTRLRTEAWEGCSGVGWPGTRKAPRSSSEGREQLSYKVSCTPPHTP